MRNLLLLCLPIFLASAGPIPASAETAPASSSAPDYRLMDELPVQDGGRRKPYFVFAQESILSLHGRTRLRLPDGTMEADEAVTRLWVADRDWAQQPIILVDYLPLKEATGLDRQRKHFSYVELSQNEKLLSLLQEASAARARDQRTPLRGNLKEAAAVGLRLAVFESLTNGSAFRVVPSTGPAWQLIPRTQPEFERLTQAVVEENGAEFAAAISALRSWLERVAPSANPSPTLIKLEVLYQRIHPFRWAWICYAAAAIVLAVTSVRGRDLGYRVAWIFVSLGALLLVAGFVARIWISGRAPVTNMYESIIWVAFGTVAFSMIFEAIYRSRWFFLGASPVAVVTLMVADAAPLKFDPGISPLVPVLQSNFWLTTHVLTITLSYAAFALALGVAHLALGKVILGKQADSAITNYVYRCLQIGVFLLATGTLLGAVWANYSWGRFWDWDPKETWALVALLVYLFILHGRIAGKWAGFGLCVGAVLGFQSIIMAWYGVNFVLGVGLHSYGFGSGGLGYAIAFVLLEFAFVGVAVWRKYRRPALVAV